MHRGEGLVGIRVIKNNRWAAYGLGGAGRRLGRIHQHAPGRKASAGVTLTELMVTIMIVSILLGIGVPSYRYMTNSSRTTTEVNLLLGDLQFARSEAIKQGLPVTICPSAAGTSCDSTSTWQNGWIIFLDNNGNGIMEGSATPADVIVRRGLGFGVATDTFVADNNVQGITFNREGFTSSVPATAAGYITITLHVSGGTNSTWTRCIQVGSVGMIQTERAGTGGCS